MVIELIRDTYTARSTTGKLFIDGEYFCFTLEDTVRPTGIKVDGETAIPAGSYRCAIRYSPGFKRNLVVLYTEPDKETIIADGKTFKYAMFHGGNKHDNTEGCPLLAYRKLNDDTIQGTAEKEFTAKVVDAIEAGEEVNCIIKNLPQNG